MTSCIAWLVLNLQLLTLYHVVIDPMKTTLLSSLETLNHREVHSSEAMAIVQQVPPESEAIQIPVICSILFGSSSNKRTICLKWPTYVAISCLIL